ncbi:glycerophosphodiester phosphodiesterase domain-containing protein 4 [Bubalus bubalis]|uniref:glycerophosphodiester phosphodiesterase domain-containing protein 4 n=1 Tax=Bubalus bubalis TaxID=89462 RepID=UPI000DBC67F4|nr:glycerophosphodiester phosphodiesterase domain-containing protein 4 isoform X1 [Bubalus bubalis]XP_025122138.1 glycerophosphodiester phosphodiesterase domain-containing protein 4 isoform X1 [Bubalus bubalis]XP_025122139.1 glycerophosphodiester phosphodiesterase domain-containing protein 4 isoform X1 [Bubalus bubalis]XP_044785266.1 glycerophosphodiester phosphodiesterase domain-containing protein 4 [Bubalus bubalis]
MDDINRTEAGNEETGRRENNSWVKRHFNYECYMTFLNGCYSCKWEAQQKKKPRRPLCCCSLRERIFYPWLIMSFLLSTILLFAWVETSNEYNGFDWVVFLGARIWFFWSLVLLSVIGILAAYTTILVVLGFLLCWEKNELYLHWYHKIMVLIVILLCSFLMWILLTFWRERWLTVGLSLQVFAPYIHLSSISAMVLLSWPVAFYLIHLEGEARMRRYQNTSERRRNKWCTMLTKLRVLQVVVGLPFLLILLCLYVVPFGTYSPCVQEKDKLAPKPDFFGHRGAPMLGPENTIMSFEKAVEQGAHGLESDVQISLDEVPFLMHDYDLRRTTNILEVMPNASDEQSSFFYWDFLSTLNAGKWFADSWIKPFFGMKPLSEADRERARNQKIPKLSELLEIARKAKKMVIFDLYTPPRSHPSRSSYIRLVVSVILDSKIEQHLIIWLPGSERDYVRSKAPGFQHIGRLFTIERLTKEKITRINVDYKNLFYNGLKEYKAANITINVYLVNEPWLFSLAWCSSIHSVTTDNIQVLKEINHPYYFMTPDFYMFMWIFLDILSAVFIVAIFYSIWLRESQSEKILQGITSYTETPSVRSLHEEVLRVEETR